MSNANAAAKVFGFLLLSLFLSFFYSVSQLVSVPLQTLHITLLLPGDIALVSLTSLTFAGFNVPPPLSASQKYLQHKDHIVCLTIRCLNFEWLPHTASSYNAEKISNPKYLNFTYNNSPYM